MNNEQYAEVRKAAMELGFEQWWRERHRNYDPETMAKLDCYNKPIARDAWHARDAQVIAQSDLIEQLMRDIKELKLQLREHENE